MQSDKERKFFLYCENIYTSVSFTESSLGGAFFEICLIGENQVQERKDILEINK